MVFDTTIANTGHKTAGYVAIQEALDWQVVKFQSTFFLIVSSSWLSTASGLGHAPPEFSVLCSSSDFIWCYLDGWIQQLGDVLVVWYNGTSSIPLPVGWIVERVLGDDVVRRTSKAVAKEP